MSCIDANTISNLVRRSWIEILDLEDEEDLATGDAHFFHLGGDSSMARDLCCELNAEGLNVSLADVFKHPRLEELVGVVIERATGAVKGAALGPFDLVPGGPERLDEVLGEVTKLCNLKRDEIEDVYPCTALQEGLVTLTQRQAGAYQAHQVFTLDTDGELTRFSKAWDLVAEACPVLRTRITQTRESGLLQVVSRRSSPVEEWEGSLESYLEHTGGEVLNRPLSRFAIVLDVAKTHSRRCFVWSIHHAGYDGRSVQLMLERLARAWAGQPVSPSAPFQAFVAGSRLHLETGAARAFWASKLEGARACDFPVSSRPVTTSKSSVEFATQHRRFAIDWHQQGSETTLATMMYGAWALVVAAHAGDDDVVFGATVSGRDGRLGRDLVAPTIATIPVRVPVMGGWPISKFLAHVQSYMAEAMPYEQMGLHNMPGDASALFRSLLVVQPAPARVDVVSQPQGQAPASPLPPRRQVKESSFHSYDLTVEACPAVEAGRKGPGQRQTDSCSVELKMHYNLAKVTAEEAEWLLRHLERAVRQLLAAAEVEVEVGAKVKADGEDHRQGLVSDVDLFGPQDWQAVKSWNRKGVAPAAVHMCMHQLIADKAASQPDAPAIDAHDHSLSYSELDAVSSSVARHLHGGAGLGMGIRRGERVLLLFEKSAWAVVAMLAVMKAGAVFVPLEWSNPLARLQQIAVDARATAVLTSPRLTYMAKQLLPSCHPPAPPSEAGSAATTSTSTLTSKSPIFIVEAASVAAIGEIQREHQRRHGHLPALPDVSPQDDAYIIFTSGSTGTPKGILVHHEAYSTSAVHHGPAYHMTNSSRILQFSSYSFDAGHVEIITGLVAGACICIPSEEDRKNDLPGVLQRMRVSWFMLTPTVIMALPLEQLLPFLRTAVFMAERSPQDLISRWVDTGITVMNTYGPTECSAISYVSNPYTSETSSDNIGLPRGCLGWVVDPHDSDKLVAVGCAGELLLEGPIISRGYLDDPVKTDASFVQNIAWRPGVRMYKTGDLVRQNPNDGSVAFVGRKDTQVKIRGQRVEISEIEQHIFHYLISHPHPGLGNVSAVAVDYVFRFENDRDRMVLAAFCCLPAQARAQAQYDQLPEQQSFASDYLLVSGTDQQDGFAALRAALAAALPSYMVPTLYVPMKAMCFNVSSKLDRKRLRSILVGVPDDIFHAYALSARKEITERDNHSLSARQSIMQGLWKECLQLDSRDCRIGLHDSFFTLGGHSVLAMKLSWLCKQSRILLDVTAIFQNPTLESMTAAAKFGLTPEADTSSGGVDTSAPQPLSLLDRSKPGLVNDSEVLDELARLSGLAVDDIADAFPCTALQEGLIALTQRKPDAYIAQHVYELGRDTSVSRFKAACIAIIHACPILRTRLVQTEAWDLVQIVTHTFEVGEIKLKAGLESFLDQERRRSVALGQHLSRFSLVVDEEANKTFFLWQAHHAAFDGWSQRLVMERLAQGYHQLHDDTSLDSSSLLSLTPSVPFTAFVRFLGELDEGSAVNFWRLRLRGARPLRFPRAYKDKEDTRIEFGTEIRSICGLDWSKTNKRSGFTLATLANTAWALVLARHADTDDVTFGATMSGRMAPVPGIEGIIGPTITTIPVHLSIDEDQSATDLLHTVQMYFASAIPFEQFGLQRITGSLGPDAQAACSFRTLLVVQPLAKESPELEGLLSRFHPSVATNKKFHTYDITVEALERGDGGLELRMHHNRACVSSQQAYWLLSHFESVISRLLAFSNSTLDQATSIKVRQVSLFGDEDQRQIVAWNAETSIAEVDRCIHDVIRDVASRRPSAPAIYAPSAGGDFTYGQLDKLSTLLARYLVEDCAVAVGDPILLCFEKSSWAVISMLSVLKAGASFVPLEWSNPSDRLAQIAQGVGARRVVTSERNEALCRQALPGVEVILFADSLAASLQQSEDICCRLQLCELPHVPTDQVAYIIFTSGSTGIPKGILIPHKSFSSSATHHGPAFNMNESSRVFQFSSYSFDMSLIETLTALFCGACICIPDEHERKENLAAAFNSLSANWSMLTPGVVSTLVPQSMHGLQVLALAGEATPPAMIETWSSDQTEVFVGYGPTECSAISHVAHPKTMAPSNCLIGKNVGSRSWIVKADDHSELVPVGCVGELLLEGPILATGYLDSPEKTIASFVSDLAWMSGACEKGTRRVYKTGDLVYYSPEDGSINHVGRKDTQVKIRGQRVELGEIEERALAELPHLVSATVEQVQWFEGQESLPLAVFCCFADMPRDDDSNSNSHFSAVDHHNEMLRLHQVLTSALPVYMVPTAFVPMRSMPTTVSGKIDRKSLRTMLMGVDKTSLARYRLQSDGGEALHDPPTSEAEVVMQRLWAACLHMGGGDQHSHVPISRSDNFFKLGGNSVLAMRLAGMVRQQGDLLTVADIFNFPVLSQMATVVKQTQGHQQNQSCDTEPGDRGDEPFSLLQQGPPSLDLISRICSACDLSPSLVADIYPCTPLQEGLMALTHLQSQAYIYHHVFRIGGGFSASHAIMACRSVVMANDILRTRLQTDEDGGRMLQVVTKDAAPINELRLPIDVAVAQLSMKDTSDLLSRGLSEWSVVLDEAQEGGAVFIIWTAHHAGYDGWSTPLITNQLRAALENSKNDAIPPPLRKSPPFRRFIAHVYHSIHKDASAAAFWKERLQGATQCDYPTLSIAGSPSTEDEPPHFATARQLSCLRVGKGCGFTLSTLLHAAWALVLARYTMTDDVTFGTVVSGRNAPVEGIERITGPAIATIPMRVKVKASQCVSKLLDQVRDYTVGAMPFEQMGLQHIRRLSTDAARACAFRTLFVVQPLKSSDSAQNAAKDADNVVTIVARPNKSSGRVHTYDLTFECEETTNGFVMKLHHNLSAVCEKQASWILSHFEAAVQGLLEAAEDSQRHVSDINLTGPDDFAAFLSAQAEPLELVQECLHTSVSAMAKTQPQRIAIDAWDGRLTYREVDELSTWLAQQLISSHGPCPGLEREEPVLVCLQKSKWVPVCMVAILKGGGAFVPLDYTHPLDRLKTIAQDTGAKRVLACGGTHDMAQGLGLDVLVVGPELFQTAWSDACLSLLLTAQPALPIVAPSQLSWILFTSGSTGTPKGCLIEHQAFRTSIKHHGEVFGMGKGSRVLHFSSYAFDVCTTEIFSTLITGGCICIPSEDQRKDALADFIRQYEANWAYLTPSVVSIMQPQDVPSLKTLVLGGERHSASLRATWERQATIHNAYGPAECSVCVIIASEQGVAATNIGVPRGCYPWIVDGGDPNVLVPFGCLGELLIEGPLLGRGYLNRPDETAARFLAGLDWMKSMPLHKTASGQPSKRVVYRTGDLVRYNMDGSMTFIGRKDDQVKVRGQRLELGDVQTYLEKVFAHSYQAVALVPKTGVLQNALVVALARVSDSISAPEEQREEHHRQGFAGDVERELAANDEVRELMERFEESVPPFMVPSQWIPMRRIPLSPSGKSDRKKTTEMLLKITDVELAEIRSLWQSPSATQFSFASLSATEQEICALVAQVLQLPDAMSVIPTASFIKMGGDSIKAMLLASRCKAAGFRIRVGDILASKGVRELANKAVRLPASTQSAMRPQTTEEVVEYRPSPIQDIFLAMNSSSVASLQGFTQSHFVRLDKMKRFSLDDISRALGALAARHPLLRTSFRRSGQHQQHGDAGAWTLRTLKPQDAACNPLLFTAHVKTMARDLKAAIEATKALIRIECGHVLAACLVEDKSDRDASQKLYLVAHHLVVDFVSWHSILRDLDQFLYIGCVPSQASDYPSSSFSAWSKYIQKQGSPSYSSSRDGRVERASEELSTISFDSTRNTYANTSSVVVEVPGSLETVTLGDMFASLEPVDLILGALHYSYQQTHPGCEDSLIFDESHGRVSDADNGSLDWADTVGWFTALVPSVMQRLGKSNTCIDAALKASRDRTKTRSTEAKVKLFMQLYHELNSKDQLANFGNARVVFNFVGSTSAAASKSSGGRHHLRRESLPEECRALDLHESVVRLGLIEVLASIQEDGHTRVRFIYNTKLTDREQVKAWTDAFATSLGSMVRALTPSPASGLSPWLVGIFGPELATLAAKYGGRVESVKPCTGIQRFMWKASTVIHPTLYHTCNLWKVRGNTTLSLGLLAESWSQVVQHQPLLRTVILQSQSPQADTETSCYQVVLPWHEYARGEFSVVCSGLESVEAASRLLQQDSLTPFAKGAPPYRVRCCTVAGSSPRCHDDDGLVVVSIEMHHVLMDAPSMAIVLDDWKSAYKSLSATTPSKTIPRSFPPREDSPKIASTTTTTDVTGTPTSTALTFQSHQINIGTQLVGRVTRFGVRTGFTTSTLVQAAWALTLNELQETVPQGPPSCCQTDVNGSEQQVVSFDLLLTHRGQQDQALGRTVGPLFDIYTARVDLSLWHEKPDAVLSGIQDRTIASASSAEDDDDDDEDHDDGLSENRLPSATKTMTTMDSVFKGSLVNLRFSSSANQATTTNGTSSGRQEASLVFESLWGQDPMNYYVVLSGSSGPSKLELQISYYSEFRTEEDIIRAAGLFTGFLERIVGEV